MAGSLVKLLHAVFIPSPCFRTEQDKLLYWYYYYYYVPEARRSTLPCDAPEMNTRVGFIMPRDAVDGLIDAVVVAPLRHNSIH